MNVGTVLELCIFIIQMFKAKKMKKVILTSGIAFLSIGVFAQAVKTNTPVSTNKTAATAATAKVARQLPAADQRAVQYSQELKSKLNLTPEQYTKVLAVNTECIKRKDAAKASGTDASKAISAYRQEQYKTILSADQLAKLKAMNVSSVKPKLQTK
jgi:hypothetical protein